MTVEYRIGDALEALRDQPARSAAFVHLDDAWARPNRNGAFGVEYPTHPFDEGVADDVEGDPGVTTRLTVVEMLDACYRVLESGGVLVVDCDSYLLPNVLDYARSEWSESGFAVANVVALSKSSDPDRSTPGMYLSSGGYSSVLVWRDASPVPQGHPCRESLALDCACDRQREDWGWGTVKPLATYLDWIRAYTEPGDRIVVPCAGTAPVAIAAERVHGDLVDVLCIDVEEDAKAAYESRREDELERQGTLAFFGGDSA